MGVIEIAGLPGVQAVNKMDNRIRNNTDKFRRNISASIAEKAFSFFFKKAVLIQVLIGEKSLKTTERRLQKHLTISGNELIIPA